jgi:preprotein translocase subunit SecY
MHEFLLLALVIIYLVISYVPIPEVSKDARQSQRNERYSQGNPEIDGTGSHDSPLGS